MNALSVPLATTDEEAGRSPGFLVTLLLVAAAGKAILHGLLSIVGVRVELAFVSSDLGVLALITRWLWPVVAVVALASGWRASPHFALGPSDRGRWLRRVGVALTVIGILWLGEPLARLIAPMPPLRLPVRLAYALLNAAALGIVLYEAGRRMSWARAPSPPPAPVSFGFDAGVCLAYAIVVLLGFVPSANAWLRTVDPSGAAIFALAALMLFPAVVPAPNLDAPRRWLALTLCAAVLAGMWQSFYTTATFVRNTLAVPQAIFGS